MTWLRPSMNSDDAVRVAALKALGTTVPADKLSVLIAQVVTPKHEEDAAEAERSLKAACVRMPDRDACAKQLTAAIEEAPAATKIALLKIVGAVGGTEALASLGASAKANDAEVQDASSRLLGEWMTADAAPVLLDLAKTAPGDKYRVRALRGYIRIARQFALPEPQRLRDVPKRDGRRRSTSRAKTRPRHSQAQEVREPGHVAAGRQVHERLPQNEPRGVPDRPVHRPGSSATKSTAARPTKRAKSSRTSNSKR